MKKTFLTITLFMICFWTFAQDDSYTIVGGPVEVMGPTGKWEKPGRGGQVGASKYVRSSAKFSLRDKRGMSETYNPCDCTLVLALKPLKKLAVEKHANNVISRDLAEFGVLFEPSVLNVRQGEDFEILMIASKIEDEPHNFKVVSIPDWLWIENLSGSFTDRVKICGRAKDKVLVTTVSLDGTIVIECSSLRCELPVKLTY